MGMRGNARPHPIFEIDTASPDPRPDPGIALSAGIVAHNEEGHLAQAVGSLLGQELPRAARWTDVWVVASGCTDRTVEVAKRLAMGNPLIHVVVEPERLGKAHALREVLTRSQGDAMVLLNADAQAEPGAITELLRASVGLPVPYAIMARPVIPQDADGPWIGALRAMWELHHQFHLELQREGGGAHLSDELLLVNSRDPPPLPNGIINDGAYIAVWLSQHGGPRVYAPGAQVVIDVPHRFRDHLHQRRRIMFGNAQVASALGSGVSTFTGYAVRHPGPALQILRRSVLSQRRGMVNLTVLISAEVAAKALSLWDRLPPSKDHIRWKRIEQGSPTTASDATSDARAPDSHPTKSWTSP